MLARHEEHAENASNRPYAHRRLSEAPIRGDIRYRRAVGGLSRRRVCAVVCAGGCRIRCAWFAVLSVFGSPEPSVREKVAYVIFLYLTLRMDDGWGVLTTHTIRYG